MLNPSPRLQISAQISNEIWAIQCRVHETGIKFFLSLMLHPILFLLGKIQNVQATSAKFICSVDDQRASFE